jgi:hypothetical protein
MMKKWVLAGLIFFLCAGVAGAQDSVVLKDFRQANHPEIGSTVTLSGPARPTEGQQVEYVLEIAAQAGPERGGRPGYVSEGVIVFQIPQSSLSHGGGMYIHYDAIRIEVFDARKKIWLPLNEEKNADMAYLQTLPLRALPFGVGLLAGYLIDRDKYRPEDETLTEEEYRNYYKEVSQFWSKKYQKLRMVLPVTFKASLSEKEHFGLHLYYEEGSALLSERQAIYDPDSSGTRRVQRARRELAVDNLLAALGGNKRE